MNKQSGKSCNCSTLKGKNLSSGKTLSLGEKINHFSTTKIIPKKFYEYILQTSRFYQKISPILDTIPLCRPNFTGFSSNRSIDTKTINLRIFFQGVWYPMYIRCMISYVYHGFLTNWIALNGDSKFTIQQGAWHPIWSILFTDFPFMKTYPILQKSFFFSPFCNFQNIVYLCFPDGYSFKLPNIP